MTRDLTTTDTTKKACYSEASVWLSSACISWPCEHCQNHPHLHREYELQNLPKVIHQQFVELVAMWFMKTKLQGSLEKRRSECDQMSAMVFFSW